MDSGYENLNPLEKILFQYKLFECDAGSFLHVLRYLKACERYMDRYIEAENLYNQGASINEIAAKLNISRPAAATRVSMKRSIEEHRHLFEYL